MRTFVKPLWNVRHDQEPERTTLATESAERRYGTGRGYCVTADTAKEARHIAYEYATEAQYNGTPYEVPVYDRVQLIVRNHVPVLMAAPRW